MGDKEFQRVKPSLAVEQSQGEEKRVDKRRRVSFKRVEKIKESKESP